MPKAIAQLPVSYRSRLQVYQQCREGDVELVTAYYNQLGINATIARFFKHMGKRISSAHLVISRAGASSIAEYAVIGRPSILVPLKIAADNHQFYNAVHLRDAGGAIMVEEEQFTVQWLAQQIEAAMENWDQMADMAAKAASVAIVDADKQLAQLVESVLNQTITKES